MTGVQTCALPILEADPVNGGGVHFEDNYLFLLPGEKRKVLVTLPGKVAKTLRFLPPGVIRAKAWNSGQVYLELECALERRA